jgi:hypothetical protein
MPAFGLKLNHLSLKIKNVDVLEQDCYRVGMAVAGPGVPGRRAVEVSPGYFGTVEISDKAVERVIDGSRCSVTL